MGQKFRRLQFLLAVVRHDKGVVRRDELVAHACMIFLLRCDEHGSHRDEGVVRRDEAT